MPWTWAWTGVLLAGLQLGRSHSTAETHVEQQHHHHHHHHHHHPSVHANPPTEQTWRCYLPDGLLGYDITGCNTSTGPLLPSHCSLACGHGYIWEEPDPTFHFRGWAECQQQNGTFLLPGRCKQRANKSEQSLEISGSQIKWEVPAEPVTKFSHKVGNCSVDNLAITADGALALTSCADEHVLVWDLRSFSPHPVANFSHGPGVDVHTVHIAADAAFVASGSRQQGTNDTIHVWGLRGLSRNLVVSISLGSKLTSLAMAPDATFIVGATYDRRTGQSALTSWRLPTGETLFHRLMEEAEISAVAVTPDGSWAVTGNQAGEIFLWDLQSNSSRPEARFFHGEPITRIVVVNGARAFSSGVRLLKSWDLLTRLGSAEARMDLGGTRGSAQNLAVTPDGVWLLRCGEDELAVAEFREKNSRLALKIPHKGFGCQSVAVMPDGAHALTGGRDGTIRVWDIRLRSTVPSNSFYSACAPQEATITAEGRWLLSECADSGFMVWNLHTRALLPKLLEFPGRMFQDRLQALSDEFVIVTAPDNHGVSSRVELWDLADPDHLESGWIVETGQTVSKATVTRDARWLVTAGQDLGGLGGQGNRITVWALRSNSSTPHFFFESLGSAPVMFLSVTQDGQFLVVGTKTDMFVWDFSGCSAGTVSLLQHIPAPLSAEFSAWTLTPDSAWLAAGTSDGLTYVWSLRRNFTSPVQTFAHGFAVISLAATPDSAWLISGSEEGTMQLWDLRTRVQEARPTATFLQKGRLTWVTVVPSGAWMLSGSEGGYIFMWPLFHTARYNGELLHSQLCKEYDCHDRAVTLPAHRGTPFAEPVALPAWLDLTTLRSIELQGALLDCSLLPPLPWTTLLVNLSKASVLLAHGHELPIDWFNTYGRVLDMRGMRDIRVPQISSTGRRKRSVSDCHVDFEMSDVCIRRSDEEPIHFGNKFCAQSLVSLKRVDWHAPSPLVTTYVDLEDYDFWLCDCAEGFYGNGSFCYECPSDWYCPPPGPQDEAMNLDKVACPPQSGTDGLTGRWQLGQCVCEPGCQQRSSSDAFEGHDCVICPSGTFSAEYADEACTPCGFGFVPGVASSECVVNVQYFLLMVCTFVQVILILRVLPLAIGFPLPLEDVSMIDGQVVLVIAGSHYVQKHALVRIKVDGSGHEALDDGCKQHYAVRMSGRRLLLTDENGEPFATPVDASQGHLRICFPHTFLHTGFGCFPTAALLAVLGAGLTIVLIAIFGNSGQQSEFLASISAVCLAVLIALADHLRRQETVARTPLQRALSNFKLKLGEAPQVCERGAARAVTAGQVTDLFEHFQVFFRDSRDMYYLCENVVKPLTQPDQISYAELVGPKKVEWFCSHFWGTPFKHFTDSLKKHAAAVAARESRDTRSIPYWICSFSNNQWDLTQELPGNWKESSFYLALRSGHCRGTTMILDEAVLPLTRSWCLFEVLQTLVLSHEDSAFEGLLLCTSTGVLNYGEARMDISMTIAQKLATLDLRDASASRQTDKEMIDELVVSLYSSFDEVNSFVRSRIRESLLRMRQRFDVDFAKLASALQPSHSSLPGVDLAASPVAAPAGGALLLGSKSLHKSRTSMKSTSTNSASQLAEPDEENPEAAAPG